jgi:hypothetical protein
MKQLSFIDLSQYIDPYYSPPSLDRYDDDLSYMEKSLSTEQMNYAKGINEKSLSTEQMNYAKGINEKIWGDGSYYIIDRIVSRSGRDYHQYYFAYQIGKIKRSRYIPKGKLDLVQNAIAKKLKIELILKLIKGNT